MREKLHVVLAAGLLGSTTPGYSHHSFPAFYDPNTLISVEGVVTRYRFISPHTRIELNATNEAGAIEAWVIDGDSPSILTRMGFTGDELREGDVVTISGFPARDGTNRMQWLNIVLSDGTKLEGRAPSANRAAEEAIERRRRQSRE